MIRRTEPTAAALKNLYNAIALTCGREVYYSAEEVKKLKEDKNNVFIRERETDGN